ncbi:MAG: bifunctional folylpolyglutamate synthase/dihydrofolate synthase [Bacteroidota bacterium]|nr:bifunctional folylpolyglutamate synthase/dihydrofolate synthase [Bacteroidota bacterium]
MNYQETVDYLFSRLPMFQRIGSAAYKADLDNTIALCQLLDNPEKKFRSIHVAGTNGKGSTSHMLASVLQSAGLKVGLYTSPHLKDFRERIKINGQKIPENYVVEFVASNKQAFEKIDLSFFEMTVGLAFQYFAEAKVDVAVIEVGLGGRLDSTNVIRPLLSVISNISFDHTALLGDTIEKIAAEKAGIIKSGVPVVIGETQQGASSVFIDKAAKENAEIIFADKIYQAVLKGESSDGLIMDVRKHEATFYENVISGLRGYYQQKNVLTVIAVIDVLNEIGFGLTEVHIRKGIKEVIQQTSLLGRWQTLSQSPLIIADTAHNEAGITEVVSQLKTITYERLHFVLGMVNDKDISKVLSLLPKEAIYYFCKANIPRALDAQELYEKAAVAGLKGKVIGSVADALAAATSNATAKDLIFVGGSTFVVAEVV